MPYRLPERNCGGEVALYQNAPLPFTFAVHFCPLCCYRWGGQSVVPYNANSFRSSPLIRRRSSMCKYRRQRKSKSVLFVPYTQHINHRTIAFIKIFSFFLATSAWSALEIFMIMRYINSHLHLHTFTHT